MKPKAIRDPAEIPLQPLSANPRFNAAVEKLAAINARIAAAQKRRRVAEARSRGQNSTTPLADRAAALLKGGQVQVLPPSAEIEAAEEEERILITARIAAEDELRQVRGEESYKANKLFASLSADAHRLILDGAEVQTQGKRVLAEISGRLAALGYELNEHALPMNYGPTIALGDPDRAGTAWGLFKQWLRDRGII